MMKKYIDAGVAFKVLSEYFHHRTQIQHMALSEALDKVPAADVQEVKRGHWDDERVAFYLKCSECGCCVRAFSGEVFLDYGQEWNYCPNCGAKMDEEGETTEETKCEDMRIIIDALRSVPPAQQTIYGYDIEHLATIARILDRECWRPDMAAKALSDIYRIVEIVRKEFEEALRKAAEQCTI